MFISISGIAGFVGLVWMARSRTIRPFPRNRHGRLSESNVLRHLFETVVELYMAEGLVGADGFAVDASLPRTPTSGARCQATSAHFWFHNFSAIVGQFDKVALFPPSRIATIGSSCEHGQN